MLHLAAASLVALMLSGCAAAVQPTPVQYYEPLPTRQHAPQPLPAQPPPRTKATTDRQLREIDASVGGAINRIDQERAKAPAQ